MKHLNNVLNGFANAFVGFSNSRRYVGTQGGFRRDSEVLAKDVRTISRDIRKQTNLAYESIATSTGKKR